MPHQFDPTILREYDIRGIVGQSLFTADAHAIGRAFAATLTGTGARRRGNASPSAMTGG